MAEIAIATELINALIVLFGALAPTLPLIAKFRSKAKQGQAFLTVVNEAMEDDKLTPTELRTIMKLGRELIGVKK